MADQWVDDDGTPIESRDEHVATFGPDDDPAEEDAAQRGWALGVPIPEQPGAEPGVTETEFGQATEPDENDYDILTGHSTRSAILRLHERMQGAWNRINTLEEHLRRLGDRLERLEADLGVDDEFGDRPLPLDTPDIASLTVDREPLSPEAHAAIVAATSTVLGAGASIPLAEPPSLDEINRRARAEAEALREQDLAEGQGLAGVPEMVPAPLDDDMTAHDGFR